MEKFCECGKPIKGDYEYCYNCSQKKFGDKFTDPKKESIERQVAAKCVAQHFTGKEVDFNQLETAFVKYLELITGRKV